MGETYPTNTIEITCFQDWLYYYHIRQKIKLTAIEFSAIIEAHKNFKE